MGIYLAVYGLVMLVAAALGGLLAWAKNRDISAWIAWSFLIPPMVLLFALLPHNKGPRPRRMTLDEEDAMY
jgi:hypothetical protein